PAPVGDYTRSTAGGVAPVTVDLTDLSTNTPTSWAWDFGNGGAVTDSTLQNPSVTYAVAGVYTITLIASNAGGASAPVTSIITVTAPPVPAPTASFFASATAG